MPAPAQVSELTERKRQIVAEADRHRDAIGVELRRVTQRVDDAKDFVESRKTWLWGGGIAVAGLLLFPTLRTTLGALAEIPDLLRGLRR
jgi:hypothetical protein